VRFLVIGDGCEREKVRHVATELGVLNRSFFMLDSVPKKEMPAVLSAADMATSTVIDRKPLWANSANKVFDALAAGRPIAINHEGWLADVIRQNACGLVLPVGDLKSAAEHLVATLDDPAQLSLLGKAAHQVARDQFDRDMLAWKLETVIRATAEQRRGRVVVPDFDGPATIPFGSVTAESPDQRRKAA
jgi:glycosyltransferase involved in cell wall biosynthesis